jgi:hypothetical protein
MSTVQKITSSIIDVLEILQEPVSLLRPRLVLGPRLFRDRHLIQGLILRLDTLEGPPKV